MVHTITAFIRSENLAIIDKNIHINVITLQPVLFAILIVALLAMIFGFMSGDEFAYLAVPLVFLTIMLPQLGGSPKYSELVDILEKQLPQKPTMEDVLSQELKKT